MVKTLLPLMHMIIAVAPRRFASRRRTTNATAPSRRATAITAEETRVFRRRSRYLMRAIAAFAPLRTACRLIDCLGAIYLLHYRQPVVMRALPIPIRRLRIQDIPISAGSDFKNHFRFKLSDMETLVDALDLPQPHGDGFIRTARKGYKYSNEEGVLMWLYYFARTGDLSRMRSVFGGSAARISEILNDTTQRIFRRWRHRIVRSDLRHMDPLLSQHATKLLARVGGAANLPWHVGLPIAFVDAKCLQISRPSVWEDVCYSGYKHMHSLNFQIMGRLDGIVEDVHGGIEGRHSDPYLYRGSRLAARFQAMRARVWGNEYAGQNPRPLFKMYADGIYALTTEMGRNFRRPFAPGQAAANAMMAPLRVAVEHMFAKVSNLFRQVHVRRNNKILASPVSTQYIVAHLFTNAHTCFYGSQTGAHFDLNPPNIYQYFS